MVFWCWPDCPAFSKADGGDTVIACLPSFGEIWFYYGDGVGVDWEDIIIWAF